MRVCLMVEGQEDVLWDQWIALVEACETGGFDGLFRSDHYQSVMGRAERGSLDAWTTLAGLAAVTQRIGIGTAVSPATFRHPSVLAKSVATVDHISGGRVELGMGAGWLEAEHRAYGFPFPDLATRMEVLEEQVEIVIRSWSDGSFDFGGRHYRIQGLDALPKPLQRPHPNLIIGGHGKPRSIALAAAWGNEYNTTFPTPAQCEERRAAVEQAFERAGRDPAELTFSIMTACVVGRDEAELQRRAGPAMTMVGHSGDFEGWASDKRESSVIGTVDEAADQLRRYESAGVDRVLLQHLAHTDTDMVRLIGAELIPLVS